MKKQNPDKNAYCNANQKLDINSDAPTGAVRCSESLFYY